MSSVFDKDDPGTEVAETGVAVDTDSESTELWDFLMSRKSVIGKQIERLHADIRDIDEMLEVLRLRPEAEGVLKKLLNI